LDVFARLFIGILVSLTNKFEAQ